jgi:hypothetical protein
MVVVCVCFVYRSSVKKVNVCVWGGVGVGVWVWVCVGVGVRVRVRVCARGCVRACVLHLDLQ